jgi:hypothetical protein
MPIIFVHVRWTRWSIPLRACGSTSWYSKSRGVQPLFSIFKIREDGSLNWVEGAETLESAKQRVEELAKFSPGRYVIVDHETGDRLSISTCDERIH